MHMSEWQHKTKIKCVCEIDKERQKMAAAAAILDSTWWSESPFLRGGPKKKTTFTENLERSNPTSNGWHAKMEVQSEHAHVARMFFALSALTCTLSR